ncbi:pectate lyase [Lachnotalea glycerini]|uniref:Pectate lyase n=2 Tax=Lachnotalea glycerini TaxID=1763509 RepID=A0A318EQM3_9FIRM|nr:pectate lyase [Lachnotalea glycerini]
MNKKIKRIAFGGFLIGVIAMTNLFGGTKTAKAAPVGGYSYATGSTESKTVVKSFAELQKAFNEHKHHIVISGYISAGSTIKTFTFADTSWNNVTVEGEAGGKAVLENIQLKFDGELLSNGTNISNIVVKNITFRGNISVLQKLSGADTQPGGIGTNYLGISFRRTTNALVDHCTIYDTSDDLTCVTLGSDKITFQYCHFYFSNAWVNMNPNPIWNWVGKNQDLASERLAMVIGANRNDSYEYGGKMLHVTLHHNWFGPNMKGRPLIRGFVHEYNNYFDNSTGRSDQYNANQIGSGSVIYSEANYFYKTNQSNQVGLDQNGDSYKFYERNNVYNGTTGTSQKGASFPSTTNFGYTYTAESASLVPSDVQNNAGPK